jgi:ketosteroid isomerase-like protein
MHIPSVQFVQDSAAISAVVYRYAAALDTRDWALLRSIMTDPVWIDYSSFKPELNYAMPAQEWLDRVTEGLTGFDVTQHMSSNHLHSIDGDTATCVSYMRAAHFLREGTHQNSWFLYGHYTTGLVRSAGRWLINRVQLTITASEGDATLFERATARFLEGR